MAVADAPDDEHPQDEDVTGGSQAGPAPLWADREFAGYWLARVVSLAGSAATYIALPGIAYRLTRSPLVLGGGVGGGSVPLASAWSPARSPTASTAAP